MYEDSLAYLSGKSCWNVYYHFGLFGYPEYNFLWSLIIGMYTFMVTGSGLALFHQVCCARQEDANLCHIGIKALNCVCGVLEYDEISYPPHSLHALCSRVDPGVSLYQRICLINHSRRDQDLTSKVWVFTRHSAYIALGAWSGKGGTKYASVDQALKTTHGFAKRYL